MLSHCASFEDELEWENIRQEVKLSLSREESASNPKLLRLMLTSSPISIFAPVQLDNNFFNSSRRIP
jgi:hypothetical protein